MFLAGYKGWYASSAALDVGLNGGSGGAAMQLAPSLAASAGRIAGELAQWLVPPPRARPKGVEESLEFVVAPLSVPSALRPSHEPHVLYVRLAAPMTTDGARRYAVLPDAGQSIAAEIALGEQTGRRVLRGVLVGADSLVDPRAIGGAGHEEALGQLVAAIRAFADARVPFVWRTRGGIQGPIPPALATALVEAGALATVELGVPTLDEALCRALEGSDGATPEQRLRLASALSSRGVTVRGLVDPLVPMLTDQQQELEQLVVAFAEAGIHKLGARYIVLTRDRQRAVAARLTGMHRALLQGVFADEPWHKPDPEAAGGLREVHKRIPAHLRRAGHHRLLEAGARHGIFVDILDPVAEGEDLTGSARRSGEGAPVEETKPRKLRRRPQLELFRKSQPR